MDQMAAWHSEGYLNESMAIRALFQHKISVDGSL